MHQQAQVDSNKKIVSLTIYMTQEINLGWEKVEEKKDKLSMRKVEKEIHCHQWETSYHYWKYLIKCFSTCESAMVLPNPLGASPDDIWKQVSQTSSRSFGP